MHAMMVLRRKIMPIAVHYHPISLTRAAFEDILKRLEAKGLVRPQGRMLHVCYGPEDNLEVFDIWSSQQEFDAFGATLMPIIEEAGLQLEKLDVREVFSLSNENGQIEFLREPTTV
jgi:hypothetical protein